MTAHNISICKMAASTLSFNYKPLINGSKVSEATVTQTTATSQIPFPLTLISPP